MHYKVYIWLIIFKNEGRPRVFTYLLLQLQHLFVLLALPVSEFFRVLPHLPHQLRTLSLHRL